MPVVDSLHCRGNSHCWCSTRVMARCIAEAFILRLRESLDSYLTICNSSIYPYHYYTDESITTVSRDCSTMAIAVETTVNYFHPDEARVFYPGTAGYQRRRHNTRTVTINDLRGREQDFTLDKNGFQVLNARWSEQDVEDKPDHIRDVVFTETIEKVKQAYVLLNTFVRSSTLGSLSVQNGCNRCPPLFASGTAASGQ